MEIQVRHRQGESIKSIARSLGVSRNTVRKYLRTAEAPAPKERRAKPTKLDGFQGYLHSRVEAARPDWIPAAVLFREIQTLGYRGGVRTVSNYLATLKPRAAEDPVVRFETEPGQQMQVDWGAFRLGKRRISLFLSTLGWSRVSFGLFVENERFETLAECHAQAFEAFQGVPKEVLYDNMRTVVQQRDAYGRGLHRFHPGLNDLARRYGFLPRLCRPYRARTKGKVERAIGYVRRSFFVPTVSRYRQLDEPLSLPILNQELARWLALTANQRTHGTTGAVPHERWQAEVSELQPLPATPPSEIELDKDRSLVTRFPVESLQHPLATYDALLESA